MTNLIMNTEINWAIKPRTKNQVVVYVEVKEVEGSNGTLSSYSYAGHQKGNMIMEASGLVSWMGKEREKDYLNRIDAETFAAHKAVGFILQEASVLKLKEVYLHITKESAAKNYKRESLLYGIRFRSVQEEHGQSGYSTNQREVRRRTEKVAEENKMIWKEI